ncbi:MAG TPA: hypothetical protein VFE34_09955 [Dongiaceae bacterium]|jgi:hypothetical protein|nr:hypothetical protein [Dongiaceae bacterium]
MPIFSRRRLHSILEELAPHLSLAKRNDLSQRLEHKNTKTALAAEAELSMLWAISHVAQMTNDPKLPNSSHRPDAASDDLFVSGRAVIEIRALSDDSFSGREAMERTANIVAGYADQVRKRAGQHLHFEFNERSYWDKRYHRERCVDANFTLSAALKQQVREWLTAPSWPDLDPVRIVEGQTDVVVSWHKLTSRYWRVFSRMPPVAYDLKDNPVYKALEDKADQIKGAAVGTIRCVFLVDAGCYLLRRLQPLGGVWEIGGDRIIWQALNDFQIDVVCVFSPFRVGQIGPNIVWHVTYFDSRTNVPAGEYDRLKRLSTILPRPRFEGYQARDHHRQGNFHPAERGWYVGTSIAWKRGGAMTIKMSARLLQEYLAGRMDSATFQQHAFHNDRNHFHAQLVRGFTIQNVSFESRGLDEDDDTVVFELDFDWAAASLKASKKRKAPGQES